MMPPGMPPGPPPPEALAAALQSPGAAGGSGPGPAPAGPMQSEQAMQVLQGHGIDTPDKAMLVMEAIQTAMADIGGGAPGAAPPAAPPPGAGGMPPGVA